MEENHDEIFASGCTKCETAKGELLHLSILSLHKLSRRRIEPRMLDHWTIRSRQTPIHLSGIKTHMTSIATVSNAQQDPRVTARLIARIKRLIADGSVARLRFPPEREMAKEFGANRASVRQALKVLEMMGVLSQRVGDGTYLSESAETILNEPIDFLVLLDDLSHHELFETRLIVEPELAARAAERATAEDISAMRNAVLALERSKALRDRLEADMAFHNAIFRASGNRICQLLFKGIHRTVVTSMKELSERVSVEQPLSSTAKSTPRSVPATRKLPAQRCGSYSRRTLPAHQKILSGQPLMGCRKSLASLSRWSRQAEESAWHPSG